MRPADPLDKRAFYPRKTIPKGSRVRSKKNGFDRNATVKRSEFRSNFELNMARSLARKSVPYEYESTRLTYVPKPRTYTPDFYLPDQKIFIEAKGYFDKGDRVKMQLVKEQYPDHDIRIVFLNSKNKIYRGSKTTYGMWADKHGFEWAEGAVPEEWLKDDDR